MKKIFWAISTLALCASLSVTAFAETKKKATAKPTAEEPAKTKPSDEPAATAPKRKALVDEVSGQGYGMAGCGLGSIVFGDKPGKIQILSSLTHMALGEQTFAITSGTSNCVDAQRTASAELFIEVNRVALESDIARGQGETINHLAAIMGCQYAEPVAEKLQKNFSQIFPQQGIPAEQVTETIKSMVNEDKALGCKTLG